MNTFYTFDRRLISFMSVNGGAILRVALGVVFVWFGALKIIGESPVRELIGGAYSFLPLNYFLPLLGIWEMLIGIGLIFRLALRVTLALLWLQMAGTFLAPLLSPSQFFSGANPLLLTTLGEFVVKNIVLIAASIVIGGQEVRPVRLDI